MGLPVSGSASAPRTRTSVPAIPRKENKQVGGRASGHSPSIQPPPLATPPSFAKPGQPLFLTPNSVHTLGVGSSRAWGDFIQGDNRMRKVMMAVMAVAAAGLMTTGCSRKSEVPAQHEVAQTRLDLAKAKEHQDIKGVHITDQKSLTPVQQQTDDGTLVAHKNLSDDQKEPSEAQARDIDARLDDGELSATGGSGLLSMTTEEIQGTIQTTTDKSLTLIIPGEQDRLMRFTANEQVKVMRDDQPLTLQSLKTGDEVRASYQVDEHGVRVLRSLNVTKVSAPKPAMRQ